MLSDKDGFVRLPNERPIWKSSQRTALSLTTPRAYPGNSPLNIKSENGTLYLTNQRVVYLPGSPTEAFKSFSASLLNLHDSHMTMPWFGPNAWEALVQPVAGGNIPDNHHVELKLTFKDGGAPDFHTQFERIKERLQQAVDNAREANAGSRSGGAVGGVNMDTVHLDELPTYENSGHDRMAPPEPPIATRRIVPRPDSVAPSSNLMDEPIPQVAEERQAWAQDPSLPQERPVDAPPGYEETQHRSLEEEMTRRFNRGQGS
jgi:WW domain-binding protein 2